MRAPRSTKLTEAQALEIYRRANGRESLGILSKEFGVHRITIAAIRDKKAWRHLWTAARP
jgi:hypothetical protein